MAQNLVKSLVVSFGFLNGIWLAVGINPQDELIHFLQPILSGIHPWIMTLFIILPGLLMIGTVITILKIYRRGGIAGAAAVMMAFIAGAVILQNYIVSIGLMLMALIIGQISFRKIF